MAASQTTRLAIYTWTAGTDTFTRDQMTTSHSNIEARVAGYNQDSSRPAAAAAYQGFFHYSSTDSTAGVLSYSNGTAWFDIGSLSSSTPTSLDGSGSSGSAQSGSRSDHKHAIDNDAITNAMIADNAVQAAQLNADAVTTAKILNDNVTLAKIQNSAGFGVIGKGDTGSGDFTELTASDNQVLRRSGSGNLEFGTLVTANIGNDQITSDKLNSASGAQAVTTDVIRAGAVDATALKQTDGSEAVTRDTIRADAVGTTEIENGTVTLAKLVDASAGYSIIAKVGTGTGDFGQLAAGTNSVLLRDGSDDLEFGKIDRYHIATNADIQGTQLADDAIGDDQFNHGSVQVYGKEGSAPAGHIIYAKTQSPTDASITGSPGDIYLQYTT